MNQPIISICLLAHNSVRYIGTAIESVLAQTLPDWEMIISDDASTDGTGEIVRPYLVDPRIRYIRQESNLRQGDNWAYTIEHTSAPYLATLHADDAWESYALATFGEAFRADPDLDLVWANWDYYDPTMRVRARSAPVTYGKSFANGEAVSWLVTHNHALPSASAFSRKVAVRAGLPDGRYGMLCDRDYFLRLAMEAIRCRAIPRSVTRYRQHFSSVTHEFSTTGKLQDELSHFAKNVGILLGEHPNAVELAQELREQLGGSLFLDGINAAVSGKFSQAYCWVGDGIRLSGLRVCNLEMLRNVARLVWHRIPRACHALFRDKAVLCKCSRASRLG